MVDFERLYTRIKERGMTQKFLCVKAGKGRQYISDARNGNGSISAEALQVFADALDTTTAWLTGESDEKEKTTAPMGGGLVDAIIMGRDGKTIRRTYPKEQMDALYRLLDELPHTDEEL